MLIFSAGWAGDASNIAFICELLHELGFTKVSGILDVDKFEEVIQLKNKFPTYHFSHIAANDIRTKPERKASKQVDGLLDKERQLKPQYRQQTKELFLELNAYMEK